ncbi:MAG: hypothetical protein LBQ03_03230 [Puniceicoccales bacterium]|jgi:hypothetical protein|nr:hypothetical protein [Puniceicoccales bacterium]
MDVEAIKARTRDVMGNIFRELGQMSGFIPGIGLYRSKPLAFYNNEASSETLQHIAILFIHQDGAVERAGVISPSVLFAISRGENPQPILYFSLKLDFLQNFAGFASVRYGQEEMIAIIRRNFEAFKDKSFSVYFEHCNRFMYHKAALLAGSIPGWVSHRRGAGRGYRGLKGHLLYIMDHCLHYEHLGDIPSIDLVKLRAKILSIEGMETLVPRDWNEHRLTTLSFVRLWNCNAKYEYVYDMAEKFWLEYAPEESKKYIEFVKKEHSERVIAANEVKSYLREYENYFAARH